MENINNNSTQWDNPFLDSEKLKSFFVSHLNRIFGAKQHLVSQLPLIVKEVEFADLKDAIQETVVDVEKQIARMEVIYSLLDEDFTKRTIFGLTGLVQDAFAAIKEYRSDPELRDMSIIFYLQNIESVEMASFQILQMAAVRLKNRHVVELLDENYREAKADRALLLFISSRYMSQLK